MKIDWKKKLTSRKLWIAVVGFVTPLLLAFGMTESDTTQIASIIMAGATMIAYIIGEGLVDSSSAIAVSDEEEDEGLYSTNAIGFEIESEESEDE